MKLYDGGKAPNPRRVRIFLHEKALKVDKIPVDMNNLGHKSEEITELNPLQRLPVLLLDDGTVITESVAICRYFEELHPKPPLLGTDAKDKALVEMWQRRMELNLLLMVGGAFRHLHPAMKEWEVPQIAEYGESCKPKAIETIRWLDRELAHREFVAGDNYTIADITGLIAVDFMKPARLQVPEECSNFIRWYNSVKARPSADA